MSVYFQDLLAKLRDNSPRNSVEHNLFLLGTGVNYVDRPTNPATDKTYIRGETFSYAAQLMTHLKGEQESVVKYPDATNNKSDNYAHPYHSNSVDIINGADTPGFEVGDRLAKALMLALGAVADGKTNLGISGFSRGGVEAIVLTHELQRVLSALEEDAQKDSEKKRSLAAIIKDSNSVPGMSIVRDPSYTRSALSGLVTNEVLADEEELKAHLLANLKKLQVKLFVLDPVPGGNFGKVIRIGWQEQAFYTLPAFVTKKFEFVQKHETSNAFKPIIPLGMPYEVIPGCHGTGDGNQFDHNGYPVPAEFKDRDLSGVQDLVLRRWIDFMFPDATIALNPIDLGHPLLDAVTNAYLPSALSERNSQLLENYSQIQANYLAFEWLATRNYTGLGQYMAQRQTHFHQRGNTPITDLDVHGDGKTFLNLQHVKLWMSNKLEAVNFFEMTLVEQITWLKDNIKTAFTPIDMTQSIADQTHMVARLLQDKNNHPLVKESLSYLVSMVTQTYLRNHLSQEERDQCRQCVASTFETLDAVVQNRVTLDKQSTEFAASLNETIKSDVTFVVVQHQNALLSQSIKLLEDGELLSNTPISSSSENNAVTDEKDALAWLINAQKVMTDLKRLSQQIPALDEWCNQSMLMESWTGIIPKLEVNGDGASYNESKGRLLHILRQQQELLLSRASDLLKRMPSAMEEKPEELDHNFYQDINQFGNMQKRERVLIDKISSLESSLKDTTKERDDVLDFIKAEQKITAELALKVTNLERELAGRNELLAEAMQTLEAHERRSSEIDEALDAVKTLGVQLKAELDQSKEEIRNGKVLLQSAKDQIELLESQVLEKQGVIKELYSRIDSLTETTASQERTLALNKEAAAKANDEIQALKEALESQKNAAVAIREQAERALAEAQFKIELLLQKNEETEKQIGEVEKENLRLDRQLESQQRNAENAEILSSADQEEIKRLRKSLESQRKDVTARLDAAGEVHEEDLAQIQAMLKALEAQKKEAAASSDKAAQVHAEDQARIEEMRKALEAQKKEAVAGSEKATQVHAEDQARIEEMRQALDLQKKEAVASAEKAARDLAAAKASGDALQAELDSHLETSNAYKSSKERAAIVAIAQLLEKTTLYRDHLNSSNNESTLLNDKKQIVQQLLGHLQNTDLLPSKQLEAFNDTLQQNQETLKEHRDPAWQRFFRDCVRIITIALSGIGFYRMIKGESPAFFKPSEGESYVDDVTDKASLSNKAP